MGREPYATIAIMDVQETQVQLPDGRALEVVVGGAREGALVVHHHGTPGAAGAYDGWLAAARERGLRLAVSSRPGYGRSDRDEGRTVASCAADAAAVADALGAERFYTSGGSGGGPHALACAALLGDRIVAAASVAGVAPLEAEGLEWLEGMGPENHEEVAAARAGPEQLREFIEAQVPGMTSGTPEGIVAALGGLVSEVDRAVLNGDYGVYSARQMRKALGHGYWGWFDDDMAILREWGFDLAAIAVPVTVWQGAQDRFVPFAHGQRLAAHVPGATPRLLPDDGHLSIAFANFGAVLDGLLG
jgi:pimeloyl-ACP methyl ester carboxylesterase